METSNFIVIPKALVEKKGLQRASQLEFPNSTAVIRWQADVDERWEVETLHRGFRHLETAAVFVAGIGAESPSRLRLARNGEPLLVFPNGATNSAWVVDARVFEVANDQGQERRDLDTKQLAAMLGDQRCFGRVHGYVIGPGGDIFDVSIGMGPSGAGAAIKLWPCSGRAGT